MLSLIAMLACSGDLPAPPAMDEEILAACGNGVLEADEQCDDGAANSDTEADTCRSSCRLPSCGDGVTDADERCDDGNTWGGDGCTPSCAVEDGQLEAEPNDSWDAGQELEGTTIHGALTTEDTDCFTFEAFECETLAASLSGDCANPTVLSLHDPSGALVAAAGYDAAGCAVIDPVDEPGARFAPGGTWAVCLTGLLGAEVPAYTLTATAGDSSDYDLELSTSEDFDADGLIDDCDSDRDGDGLDNDEDNCPETPNGPTNISPTVDSSGFIRHWLTIGPFVDGSSSQDCLPTETELLGDDAAATPALGDSVDELSWQLLISDDSRIEFLDDYGDVDAPREVYAAVYVHSEDTQDLTLALGPDDGARAWIDGEMVLEISGCQGTNVDQFTADITLIPGWNRLLLKVYDQGGGWGTYARFLDAGEPVLGLELSLSPDGGWDFDQTDTDGDGIGDICDED